MITLKYTVIYPAVKRELVENSDPEREIVGCVGLPNDSIPREEVCDLLFAGFGNHPGNEWEMGQPGYKFTTGNPTVDSLHRRWRFAQTRSMSVGDVVHFENSKVYYICDSNGWLPVSYDLCRSWLNSPRRYGCDMFELNQWKKSQNLS